MEPFCLVSTDTSGAKSRFLIKLTSTKWMCKCYISTSSSGLWLCRNFCFIFSNPCYSDLYEIEKWNPFYLSFLSVNLSIQTNLYLNTCHCYPLAPYSLYMPILYQNQVILPNLWILMFWFCNCLQLCRPTVFLFK